jgi:uncharacterized protein YycO
MKTHGIAADLPPFSVSSPTGLLEGTEPARPIAPGDIVLGRAHGRKHQIIKWGQARRLAPEVRHFAGYTHAALVISAHGDLVEAVGEGVQHSSLTRYVIDEEFYQVVRIEAADDARERVVEFAAWAAGAHAPYASLATVCTAFWAFTGSRLMFFMDGSFTCSGLVAASLERMGARFSMNAAKVTPAQLAVMFGAPPPVG